MFDSNVLTTAQGKLTRWAELLRVEAALCGQPEHDLTSTGQTVSQQRGQAWLEFLTVDRELRATDHAALRRDADAAGLPDTHPLRTLARWAQLAQTTARLSVMLPDQPAPGAARGVTVRQQLHLTWAEFMPLDRALRAHGRAA